MFQSFVFAFALACAPLSDDTVAPPKQVWFERPVRVAAGGRPIDHGEAGGHCGPTLRDVDGDGARDLVVGDASGRFTVYRNVGTNRAPEFANGVRLKVRDANAGGPPIGVEARVPAAGAAGPLGSSPRFADFDADGAVDLLSGGYDPGAFWLFPALDGDDATIEFEAGRELAGSDGKPLRCGASNGSWLDLADWDDDGDLDLVAGGLDGGLFVFTNEGTRTTPGFAPVPAPVAQSDGLPARVPGGHAALVVADWDDDGRFDLVSGSATGAVVWFRNVGVRARPLFAPPEALVPATPGGGRAVWLEPGAEPRPGVAAQIDVVDWNGDGRLDLLVGDFCTTISPRADLTEEQKRAVASLRLQRDSATVADAPLRTKLDADLARFLVKSAGDTATAAAEPTHGWVWLYPRK